MENWYKFTFAVNAMLNLSNIDGCSVYSFISLSVIFTLDHMSKVQSQSCDGVINEISCIERSPDFQRGFALIQDYNVNFRLYLPLHRLFSRIVLCFHDCFSE